jgi:hypothetical protein
MRVADVAGRIWHGTSIMYSFYCTKNPWRGFISTELSWTLTLILFLYFHPVYSAFLLYTNTESDINQLWGSRKLVNFVTTTVLGIEGEGRCTLIARFPLLPPLLFLEKQWSFDLHNGMARRPALSFTNSCEWIYIVYVFCLICKPFYLGPRKPRIRDREGGINKRKRETKIRTNFLFLYQDNIGEDFILSLVSFYIHLNCYDRRNNAIGRNPAFVFWLFPRADSCTSISKNLTPVSFSVSVCPHKLEYPSNGF